MQVPGLAILAHDIHLADLTKLKAHGGWSNNTGRYECECSHQRRNSQQRKSWCFRPLNPSISFTWDFHSVKPASYLVLALGHDLLTTGRNDCQHPLRVEWRKLNLIRYFWGRVGFEYGTICKELQGICGVMNKRTRIRTSLPFRMTNCR